MSAKMGNEVTSPLNQDLRQGRSDLFLFLASESPEVLDATPETKGLVREHVKTLRTLEAAARETKGGARKKLFVAFKKQVAIAAKAVHPEAVSDERVLLPTIVEQLTLFQKIRGFKQFNALVLDDTPRVAISLAQEYLRLFPEEETK